MKQFKFDVQGFKITAPTYGGKWVEIPHSNVEEFGDPEVPVYVHPAEGVRIVLGTHDYHDLSKPDIQVERRHNGWVIFLHPLGGSDPSGCVYFLDDGRSFVVKEEHGAAAPIEMLDRVEAMEEIDDIKSKHICCDEPAIVLHNQPHK